MSNNATEIHPKLQVLIPVAEGLVQTFGDNIEVAVHDLRCPESSLIYVAGTITKRKIGAPVTNIVLENIKKYGDDCKDIIGYKNVTKDGRILKSSTIFVRDNDRIIGCLCINFDITQLTIHHKLLGQLTTFNDEVHANGNGEFFASDINEVLDNMVEQVISKMGLPPAMMQKEEKINIVVELDDRGVFLIKGAVDKVAAVLGVSRYTVYNYLEEGRSNRLNRIM